MNWWQRFFGEQVHIECPRCLHNINLDKPKIKPNATVPCPECHYGIPPKYALEYRSAYPIFIQLFGWSQVGKSMFLDVLRLMLYMHPIWPEFTCDAITQLDFDHKATLLSQRVNGDIPNATLIRERDQNEPYIMLLNDMQRWNSRFLVMLDHAGEQFQNFSVPEGEIPFLQHCPTTIMLYSLSEKRSGRRIEDLMSTYINSLESYGVDFRKTPRKLVVVFTKGDTVTNIPENLTYYLNSDETWQQLEQLQSPPHLQGAQLSDYIEVMERVSDRLNEWFQTTVPGGQAFTTMARRYGIDVRFSLISAQGQDFNNRASAAQLSPKRVLDPFFFALDFQSR